MARGVLGEYLVRLADYRGKNYASQRFIVWNYVQGLNIDEFKSEVEMVDRKDLLGQLISVGLNLTRQAVVYDKIGRL